jgi:hypothetical protein
VHRTGLAAACLAAIALAPRAGGAAAKASDTDPVDFAAEILPILRKACVSCHGPQKAQGGLQLGSARRLMKGGITDDLIVPGKSAASYLVRRLRGEGDEDRMPLEGGPLPAEQIALIARWIDQGAPLPPEPPAHFVAAPGGLRRLTVAQYHNTLRDLFGPAVALPTNLEPDTLVSGSATVGAARVGLSGTGVEKFARAAARLARAALGDPAFRARALACAEPAAAPGAGAAGDARACLSSFVTAFGRRAWRRPLATDERDRYLALGEAATARGGTRAGAEVVVAALLQSPHFLYRSEIGVPDPTPEEPRRRRLTGFELASRLSYFLWNAPPDDALLDAAEGGGLDTPAGLEAESARLLRSPRARETASAFFVELFRLRRLDKIYESRSKYPQYSATLGASLRGETLRLIEEVAFDPKRDFREIFSARFTWVNGELARLYGLPAPADPQRYHRVELPADGPRRGVLGQGSFLTIFAHPSTSSPTKRGKFIREALLCQPVPPPPPNVETKLPKDDGGPRHTTRQKLAAHRKDPRCNGCHKAMDPLGLAFESFDGIGARRTSEAGLPLDTSGELDGRPFRDAAELGALLAGQDKIGACVARALFRYALGHLETEGEEPLMDELARGLARDGYKFPALVANVIKSEGFRHISGPPATAAATAAAAAAGGTH